MPERTGDKDKKDGLETDNQHKKLNPDKPFHRIESSFFLKGEKPASGITSGCRPSKNPIDQLITVDMMRAIPSWTPVSSDPDKELEGVLARSFQTWTDFPVFQWHRWYDWNFHVEPDEGYTYLRGAGNEVDLQGKTPVVKGKTMECEWDTGAFGKKDFGLEFGPGPMFSADWAWPMAGQNIWLRGHWIYDCGHANDKGQVRTELHPCKAVATARWEATNFKKDSKVVWPPQGTGSDKLGIDTLFFPALQFMFFTSRFGGYIDNGNINDRKYRFIVDLPKIAPAAALVPLAPNTRSTKTLDNLKLVCKFNQDPFQQQAEGIFGLLEPNVIPIVDPANPFLRPEQAIVEMPLPSLPANTDTYGVIISLGWVDSGETLAKRVVICTVTLNSLRILDKKGGDWAFKIGVNGRWIRLLFLGLKNGDVKQLNFTFAEIKLSLDDPSPILISTHGKDKRLVGTFFEGGQGARLLHFPLSRRPFGGVVRYVEDAQLGDDDIAGAINEALLRMMAGTFKQENKALGIADFRGDVRNIANNPPKLRGHTVEEFGRLAELVEAIQNAGPAVDYEMDCSVTVVPQPVAILP